MSNDANHGQIRRLLTTLLENGSDTLQTPSTREEALNCAGSLSQIDGTDPEDGPQPGVTFTVDEQSTLSLLRHTPTFAVDGAKPAADPWFYNVLWVADMSLTTTLSPFSSRSNTSLWTSSDVVIEPPLLAIKWIHQALPSCRPSSALRR